MATDKQTCMGVVRYFVSSDDALRIKRLQQLLWVGHKDMSDSLSDLVSKALVAECDNRGIKVEECRNESVVAEAKRLLDAGKINEAANLLAKHQAGKG